jgi:uncharacterized membrane protein YedE/YeeE
MTHFTPLPALFGGILIGLSASALLLANGRIAGISGICAGLVGGEKGDAAWRIFFVAGLLAGGVGLHLALPGAFHLTITRTAGAVVAAGFLVGFGARLANGCTSGHGLVGLSRLSPRSFVAVVTFMATGAVTVFVVNHLLGGVI